MLGEPGGRGACGGRQLCLTLRKKAMVAKFEIGQHVKVKKGVTWLPVPPGSKLNIIMSATLMGATVYYCKPEKGACCYVNADELEPVEDDG